MKYQKIVDHILAEVRCGQIRGGDQLPKEVELADLHGVSRTCVRSALRVLGERGLVQRVRGQGTFLAEDAVNHAGPGASRAGSVVFITVDGTGAESYTVALSRAIERQLSAHGVPFSWSVLSSQEMGAGELPAVLQQGLCAGILLDGHVRDVHVALMRSLGVPVVMLGNHLLRESVPGVSVDVAGSAAEACQRLADRYGLPIALVVEPFVLDSTRELLAGYETGMRELGQTDHLVYTCAGDDPSAAMADILAREPTAVLTTDGIWPAIDRVLLERALPASRCPLAVWGAGVDQAPSEARHIVTFDPASLGERGADMAVAWVRDGVPTQPETVGASFSRWE